MSEFGSLDEVTWYTSERIDELHRHIAGADTLFALAGDITELRHRGEQRIGVGALVLTAHKLVAHTHKKAGMFGGKGLVAQFREYDLAWPENTARSKSDPSICRVLFRQDGFIPSDVFGVDVSVSSASVRDVALPLFGQLMAPLVTAHRG